MAIKEMPLEEKYDKLYDFYVFEHATNYAFHKEQGTLDKFVDYYVEAFRKSMPSLMGSVVKLMKTLSPGRTLKQAINQFAYMMQMMQPLADIQLSWTSDREVVMKIKNCEGARRGKEAIRKADLNITPREMCEIEKQMHFHPRHPVQQMGMDVTCDLEENGCKWTYKLK
ncbi:MAG: hypothetical protein OEY81_03400 [Candidatus Bathyarchaeota archaeon]|nr:hypothetical protein [Candidatus Bathyarchaeota archaeon]